MALTRRLYVDGTTKFVDSLKSRLTPFAANSWEIVRLGENLGSTEAMRRLIVHSAAMGRDLLFFEDDLLLCRNAVSRIIAQRVPEDTGIVTFFDMKEVPPGTAPGLYRTPAEGKQGSGFWGAQCLKFPLETLIHLANKNWEEEGRIGSKMASDILIGRILTKHPTRKNLAVHIPNLVEHIGHASACFPGLTLTPRWRRATNFLGRDFDALSLMEMS